MAEIDYSIRPLCYSHVDLPREFFGGVPIHSGEGVSTSPMVYVLVSGKEPDGTVHHYLVDAGFAADKWIHRFGFYHWEAPEAVLAKVGVAPEDIEKVFLTHMHFDHGNNLPAFPNAAVYVQEDEFQGWCEALALPQLYTPLGEESWVTSSFDRDDLQMYGRLAGEQRLHYVRDGEEVVPGIVGHLSRDGHTFGSQWISVQTSGGPFVVAGDTVMWYSNVEEMWPSGYTNGNTYNMLLTYGEIHEFLGGEIDRIVPGHDLELFKRHTSWRAGDNEVAEVHVAAWDTSLRAGDAGR
jgi:glyoxylase-like metal-dependent hydrolase (beta-lactamase superfamily II)